VEFEGSDDVAVAFGVCVVAVVTAATAKATAAAITTPATLRAKL